MGSQKFASRLSWRLVLAALGALLVAAVALGVSALAPPVGVDRAVTPPAVRPNALQGDATPTPTPRVISIPQATPPPTPPAPLATEAAPPVVETPVATATLTPARLATVTPTPWLTVADATMATTQPTTAPSPTPLPLPTPTLGPPSSTTAPANSPAPPVQLAFDAADWAGGYYRGDGQAYGRPWTAVYGAASAYPRATLAVALDAAPTESVTLTIVGLDDEWAAQNDMALKINGQTAFSGPSPFANWDGVGNGANAAWTTVRFRIPTGYFVPGSNEIAVANLTPAANFNAPPYVLLSEASLEVSATGGEVEQGEPIANGKEKKPKPVKDQKVKEKQKGQHSQGRGAKKAHKHKKGKK